MVDCVLLVSAPVGENTAYSEVVHCVHGEWATIAWK